MSDKIKPDSLVTLHYRMAVPETERAVVRVSTFDSRPATLQLGRGELAPALEICLVGLAVGDHEVFELEAGEVFGEHTEDLVERFARADLPDDVELAVNSIVEFLGEDGNKFPGLVKEVDDKSALIDFNHPLAGRAVSFEVQIIGIL
ncbi:MAG: FKBP-type peptidyl-prolyl cis-trans isomerase [Methyloversatilis sp.]|uniref:FKBP-type peptidyl-prolyl cis-trans isomerase n=1 Tax=Methyloversatilis sp. TaxID=2569862 RepID=UPI001A38CA91|nr:FKBP-type peptidyl-prolyl cis-trans isomerase [Methyloversatilis sp.]MBL8475238.1 FKBP-type peptidyl-prolyl cis-trans isomerase [Methyloversatilis sp.]